jgi:hypothetical protein
LERKVGAIVSALADDPMLGLALQPLLDIGEDPDHGVESGELGANIGLRFRKLDLFGYFFWGHERNPRVEMADGMLDLFETTDVSALDGDALTMRVNELAAMGISAVEADYPRRVHVGGAFATRLEPVGFKVDVGYTIDSNVTLVPPGRGPLLGAPADQDVASATVSLDYNRGNELAVILEGAFTRVIGVAQDVEVYQLDGDQLLVFGGRVQWAPSSGPLELRFLGFVEARDELSYALRPALRLSGHDNLSIEVAGVIYGGPQTSLGGIQDHNDEVQLTVQYGL